MGLILLFYKYVPIRYPRQIQKWQQRLCASLGLTGRIIIAEEGINGTVGGSTEAITAYRTALQEHELFNDMDIKESEGSAADFPRLSVVIKKEIVNLGIDPATLTAEMGGRHLSPQEAHTLLEQSPADLVILDGRNKYESDVGAFVGAIKPDITHFRDFPQYIDTHLEQFKDKKVLMYCTGGVRCERASAYLTQKGVAQEVLQISGGIHRYVESYPDGFFKGKNYVFDKRQVMTVTPDILGNCIRCHTPYDVHTNCRNAQCARQLILCPDCIQQPSRACSSHCEALLTQGTVQSRSTTASCTFSSETT